MAEEKSNVTIIIHGGTNQIMPNATHAEQHFHYHGMERREEPARTCLYNNVYVDAGYITRLEQCYTASDLATVVVDMVRDASIPYLDGVLAVNSAFFTRLLPFCPHLRSGLSESNLREQINRALAVKPTRPYGKQD